MGANQSYPPPPPSPPRRPRPYRSDSLPSIDSALSAHSAPAAPSLTRYNAVRHRANSSPSSGSASYRERLMANGQVQTIIPPHYTEPANADDDILGTSSGKLGNNTSGHDHGNGNGPYHPPFLTGPDPFTIQRRRAIRTQTSPSAAPGSRREAMLRSQASSQASEKAASQVTYYSVAPPSTPSGMVSFRDMGCHPPLFTTLPDHDTCLSSAPAPQYLVKIRSKTAGPRKSRFREEF